MADKLKLDPIQREIVNRLGRVVRRAKRQGIIGQAGQPSDYEIEKSLLAEFREWLNSRKYLGASEDALFKDWMWINLKQARADLIAAETQGVPDASACKETTE